MVIDAGGGRVGEGAVHRQIGPLCASDVPGSAISDVVIEAGDNGDQLVGKTDKPGLAAEGTQGRLPGAGFADEYARPIGGRYSDRVQEKTFPRKQGIGEQNPD